jgi:hypothetical protein
VSVDHVTAVYARFWALIDAHAPAGSAIRAGNRVRLDGGRRQYVKPGGRQEADFPELVIEPTDFADSFFDDDETFGTNAADFMAGTCDWNEVASQDYAFTLTHRDPRLGPDDLALRGQILRAIRKGGPDLGLPDYVTGFSLVDGRVRTPGTPNGIATAPQPGGVVRAVTSWTIAVRMRFSGRSLLT